MSSLFDTIESLIVLVDDNSNIDIEKHDTENLNELHDDKEEQSVAPEWAEWCEITKKMGHLSDKITIKDCLNAEPVHINSYDKSEHIIKLIVYSWQSHKDCPLDISLLILKYYYYNDLRLRYWNKLTQHTERAFAWEFTIDIQGSYGSATTELLICCDGKYRYNDSSWYRLSGETKKECKSAGIWSIDTIRNKNDRIVFRKNKYTDDNDAQNALLSLYSPPEGDEEDVEYYVTVYYCNNSDCNLQLNGSYGC
eukprot:666_1